MEKQKDKSLTNFKNAFKELKNSKMVLAEKHISKLLKEVAENNQVYNLIAQIIVGYDFKGEYDNLLNKERTIKEITETDEVIPFVFCLLNEIDNNNIETVAFIRQIFGADTEDAFKEFCDQVVCPFVNRIINILTDTDTEAELLPDPAEALEDVFAGGLDERVRFIVQIITEKVGTLKKVNNEVKRDLDIICFSIDLCLERLEFAGIFGLLSGLKYLLIPLKKFKNEIAEIELVLESINNL